MHSRLRKTPNTATPGAVVQLVRIRACHARGRGFEPHPHRKNASHICEGHFSYGIQTGQVHHREEIQICENRPVRTKTFSTHDEPKICHVVRKSGVFTHGKNSHDVVGCIKTSLRLLTSPARVEPLEVRFAHPVRLAPDTHSQGHGRPCLQRLHPRRAFPATWFIFCDSFWIFIWYRINVLGGTKCLCKHSWSRLKTFFSYKTCFQSPLVPFKTFSRYEIPFLYDGEKRQEKKRGMNARRGVTCESV
ncbi:unknown [Bacteroides sp. CAG:709]|nr:unknown [Bacteroides sp. CAG:709]